MIARFLQSLLLLVGLSATFYLICPPNEILSKLTGRVTVDGLPTGDARVRFQGDCQRTLTDRRGVFHLPRPARIGLLTAWKEGYGITSASPRSSPLELTLQRLPVDDDEEYQWIDPVPDPTREKNCGNCHADIYREWAAGAHARSAQNPRLLNLLEGKDGRGHPSPQWSVAHEHPLGVAVCALCHAPTAQEFPIRTTQHVLKAVQGVHCDFCHKIVDAPTEELGTLFGRDGLKLLRPADGRQLFFGPLDDAVRAGESFGYSPLYKESRFCAACHEGVVFGVHVYGTYSEWLRSPAFARKQQCQDCHMTPTGTMHNVAPGKGGIDRDPQTLASHHFPGGNASMLGRSLKTRVKWDRGGRRIAVELRAEDVGHFVPTGFVDRHLILLVEAFDGAGRFIALSEGNVLPDAAGRSRAGRPGRLFAKLLTDASGKGPLPFWRTPARVLDTRLAPGRTTRCEFVFSQRPSVVRVRLIYNRFWDEIAALKGWPHEGLTLVDKRYSN
jgi:hypothetical protein